MHTLERRVVRREGRTPPPLEWRTPAASCIANFGGDVQATPPVSGES